MEETTLSANFTLDLLLWPFRTRGSATYTEGRGMDQISHVSLEHTGVKNEKDEQVTALTEDENNQCATSSGGGKTDRTQAGFVIGQICGRFSCEPGINSESSVLKGMSQPHPVRTEEMISCRAPLSLVQ